MVISRKFIGVCLTASFAMSPQAQDSVEGVSATAKTRSAIEEINVYGRIPDDSVKEIPQGVAVFNRDVMDISPVITVGDIVRFVPTATRDGSTLNAFGDDYLIRGFGVSQAVNGLGFNRVAHARDSANVERVEILKGPAAVLYGQMEPGAVVNVVTKQAQDEFSAEAGVELGRYDDQRYTLDVTGPFSDRVRGRLNMAYRNADTFIDFWNLEHFFVAPNLAVDISPTTHLVFEGAYSSNSWSSFQNGRPASGAFLPNPNGRYANSFNPDEKGLGFTDRDSATANLRLTQAVNESLDARFSYTYTRNEADFRETFVTGLEDDFRTIQRFMFIGKDAYENDHNLLLDLTGEATTGALRHQFIAGFNYREFDASRPARFVPITSLDMFDPVYGTVSEADVSPALPDFKQDFKSVEAFIQDRISFSGRAHLLLGLRYTDAAQDTKFVAVDGSVSPDELDETNWTTQVGLLYDVTDSLSLYANRSESFVPQFGTSSGGRPFDAEESTQYEIGTRYYLGDNGVRIDAAVFTITKENLATSDPANPGFEAAIGEVESKGFELSMSGYLLPNWYLGLTYGYLETEVKRDFDGLQGKEIRNTPENTASLQTRYDITSGLLKGLGIGGSVEYVDQRYGDSDNTFNLPSHTRVDLGLYYAVNDNIQVDYLINNATDEDIYNEGFNILRVVEEPGRTYLARFTYRLK